MSEFEYLGVCPECMERSSFWGGASKAQCEKCGKWVETKRIDNMKVTSMV